MSHHYQNARNQETQTIQMRIICRWPPRTRRSRPHHDDEEYNHWCFFHHHQVVNKQERYITFIVEGSWRGRGKVFESFWIFYSEQLTRIVQCLFNEQDAVFKAPTVWLWFQCLDCSLIALWLISDLERWRLTALDKLVPDGQTDTHCKYLSSCSQM